MNLQTPPSAAGDAMVSSGFVVYALPRRYFDFTADLLADLTDVPVQSAVWQPGGYLRVQFVAPLSLAVREAVTARIAGEDVPVSGLQVLDTRGLPWAVALDADRGNITRWPLRDQTATVTDVTDADRAEDRQPDVPRMRRSLANAVTLTATWQTLPFLKRGVYDGDTFPGGRYDETAKKLIGGPGVSVTRNYDLVLYLEMTVPLLTAAIQIRYLIPAPTPVAFPFPDATEPYMSLPAAATSPWRTRLSEIVYFNDAIRQYGFHVQARTTSLLSLGSRPTIATASALALYPR